MRAQGRGGELRCGYQLAATLGDWWFVAAHARKDERFAVTADVVEDPHRYWIKQRGLTLHLYKGKKLWRWSVLALRFSDEEQLENERVVLTVQGRPEIVGR